MADVNVIMLGGKRVGKSTILAGIMETLGLSGSLSQHFICEDSTDYEAYSKFSIKEKYKALKGLLNLRKSGTVFMTRGMGDSKIQKYNISFRLSDKPGRLKVDFYDVPGEFTNPKKVEFQSEMLPLISNCDVFIVGIDTPYLMECTASVNNALNRISDLEVSLQNILVKSKTDLKMVMLVPLKCEKWYEIGEIDKVVAKVKERYEVLLQSLSAYPSMMVSILPIATIGGLRYKEMAPAMVIKREDVFTDHSCMPKDGANVILSDGEEYHVQPPFSVAKDPEAVVDGVTIPNAWYETIPGIGYAPKNCEQTALHILRFLIVKTILEQKEYEKNNTGILGFIKNSISGLINWWNGIDYDSFKALITNLQKDGKIKDSGEGIEIYHICDEWKEVELC